MKRPGLYLIMDESNSHCGITDRFKVAVGLYWLARQEGVDFKFIHSAGFDIRRYLAPNRVPWSAELSDIYRLPWKRREVKYLPSFADIPELLPGRQYVCKRYIGKNIIEMRNVPDWQKIWRESFNDLFTPTEPVRDALAGQGMPDRYVVFNARFINSLGWNEETGYNEPLPADMRTRLIDAVLLKVDECRRESGIPVVVYSDSVAFLKAAEGSGFRTCDHAGVGHIMNRGAGDYVNLMTFVFFFQMAGAEKVYSVLNLEGFPQNSLYKSQYPRYAAILGDKPFVRIGAGEVLK